MTQRQAVEVLAELLETLDEEQRTLLVLVELEQLSVAEAATAMGSNLSTTYKRLKRAHRCFEAAWARRQARDQWRLG